MRWLTASMVGLLVAPTAFAVVADRAMTYSIHEIPTDPQSDVLYTVLLELDVNTVVHNKNDDGGTVTWDIDRISITEVDTGRDWKEVLTNTTWTTTHADLGAIDDSELVEPPLLSGVATPSDSADPDLEYDVEGVPYSGQQYYAPTAGLDHLFKEAGGATISTGDNEPAEVTGSEE